MFKIVSYLLIFFHIFVHFTFFSHVVSEQNKQNQIGLKIQEKMYPFYKM